MKTGKLLLTILALGGLVQSTQADKARTNVVFFLVDDLGWRDLGCYSSDYYKRPRIDRLAEEGVRFTDAYAACTVCSPTRAAIMTGKYPARLLLTQWLPSGRWSRTGHKMKEARYISNLPLEEVTIAEALREHGYRTAFMGKWHLGTETYYYPEHQGSTSTSPAEITGRREAIFRSPANGKFPPPARRCTRNSRLPARKATTSRIDWRKRRSRLSGKMPTSRFS